MLVTQTLASLTTPASCGVQKKKSYAGPHALSSYVLSDYEDKWWFVHAMDGPVALLHISYTMKTLISHSTLHEALSVTTFLGQ